MATPKMIAPELRAQALQAAQFSKEAGTTLPGTETLAQQESQALILKVITLESRIKAGQELQDEDILSLLQSLNVLTTVLTGPEGFVSALQTQIGVLEAQLTPSPVEQPPEVGAEAAPIAEVGRKLEAAPVTLQIDYFARFIHDFRENRVPDFLTNYPELAEMDGENPERKQVLADFIESLKKPENVEMRVDVIRQVQMALVVLFDKANDGVIMPDSWSGISIPIGTFKDSLPPVSGDREHSHNKDEIETLVTRFPAPINQATNNRVKDHLFAKIGVSDRLGKYKTIYAGRMKFDDYSRSYLQAGIEISKYQLLYFLTSSGADSFALNKDNPDLKREEQLKLHQADTYGDMVRLAGSLIDTIFLDSGREPGLSEQNTAGDLVNPDETGSRQELIQKRMKEAYRNYLRFMSNQPNRELTKLEEEFVLSAVRWAFAMKRYAGGEINYDPNATRSDVAMQMHTRRYVKLQEKAAGGGTFHKGHTEATGEVLARSIVPLEYHQMYLVRVPREALVVAGSVREYFNQMKLRYTGKATVQEAEAVINAYQESLRIFASTTEFIDALGMFPPDFRNGTGIDYGKVDADFVAIQVKPEFRTLNYPHGRWILLPRTHVQGLKDGGARFYGLHLSYADVLNLRVKDFDDELGSPAQYQTVAGGDEMKLRQMIIPDSATAGSGGQYMVYAENATSLYNLGLVSGPSIDLIKGELPLVRYPRPNVVRDVLINPQRKYAMLAGRIPYIEKVPLASSLQIRREDFVAETYEKQVRWLQDEIEAEIRVDGGTMAAWGKEGREKEQGSGIAGLFASLIKYVVDQTTFNNAARSLADTQTGELSDKKSRSLLALRRMFRDSMEYEEGEKDSFPLSKQGIPVSDAFHTFEKLHEYINAWEAGGEDGPNRLGIRLEMLFACLEIILSNFETNPLPDYQEVSDGRGGVKKRYTTLNDYPFLTVRPKIPGGKILEFGEILALKQLVREYVYYALRFETKNFKGGVEQFLKDNPHYEDARIVQRLERILSKYRLEDSFEAAVLLLQFNNKKRPGMKEKAEINAEKAAEEKSKK